MAPQPDGGAQRHVRLPGPDLALDLELDLHLDLDLDLTSLAGADIATVDVLARLQLAARRLGGSVRVRANHDLAALLVLAGLEHVLPAGPGSAVGGLRQPEASEQGSVQEAVDVDDPTA